MAIRRRGPIVVAKSSYKTDRGKERTRSVTESFASKERRRHAAHLDLGFCDIEGEVADDDLATLKSSTGSTTWDGEGLVPVGSSVGGANSLNGLGTDSSSLGSTTALSSTSSTSVASSAASLRVRLDQVVECCKRDGKKCVDVLVAVAPSIPLKADLLRSIFRIA